MSKFDALGDAQLRTMLLFVRTQPKPVTAGDAARALSVPRTVARWRLEKLTSAGLLTSEFERRGTGRPAKVYAVAPETEQVEFPPRRYETLVSLLLRRRRKSDLREIGAEFGRELAVSIGLREGAGLAALCRGLGALGFQVSVSEDADALVSATCPLRPIVVADPQARAVDEGMWAGLVERAVGKAEVECRTHDCVDGTGPCRIEVALTR